MTFHQANGEKERERGGEGVANHSARPVCQTSTKESIKRSRAASKISKEAKEDSRFPLCRDVSRPHRPVHIRRKSYRDVYPLIKTAIPNIYSFDARSGLPQSRWTTPGLQTVAHVYRDRMELRLLVRSRGNSTDTLPNFPFSFFVSEF